MDWSVIQTALLLAAQTALEDTAFDVGWKHRSAEWRADEHVLLSISSATPKGRDERRYVEEGDSVREHLYGVRILRVQFTCEAQDQDLFGSAWPIAEALISGLHESDVEEILDTAGIGIATITAPTGAEYMDAHRRTRSAVVFDVAFNANTFRVGHLVGVIDTVILDGRAVNPLIPIPPPGRLLTEAGGIILTEAGDRLTLE